MQEFDLEIKDKKGTENVVANHLSRLEYMKIEQQPINDDFPYGRPVAQIENNITDYPLTFKDAETDEVVEAIITKTTVSWYADVINYLAAGVLPPELTYQQNKKFFHDLTHYYWD